MGISASKDDIIEQNTVLEDDRTRSISLPNSSQIGRRANEKVFSHSQQRESQPINKRDTMQVFGQVPQVHATGIVFGQVPQVNSTGIVLGQVPQVNPKENTQLRVFGNMNTNSISFAKLKPKKTVEYPIQYISNPVQTPKCKKNQENRCRSVQEDQAINSQQVYRQGQLWKPVQQVIKRESLQNVQMGNWSNGRSIPPRNEKTIQSEWRNQQENEWKYNQGKQQMNIAKIDWSREAIQERVCSRRSLQSDQNNSYQLHHNIQKFPMNQVQQGAFKQIVDERDTAKGIPGQITRMNPIANNCGQGRQILQSFDINGVSTRIGLSELNSQTNQSKQIVDERDTAKGIQGQITRMNPIADNCGQGRQILQSFDINGVSTRIGLSELNSQSNQSKQIIERDIVKEIQGRINPITDSCKQGRQILQSFDINRVSTRIGLSSELNSQTNQSKQIIPILDSFNSSHGERKENNHCLFISRDNTFKGSQEIIILPQSRSRLLSSISPNLENTSSIQNNQQNHSFKMISQQSQNSSHEVSLAFNVGNPKNVCIVKERINQRCIPQVNMRANNCSLSLDFGKQQYQPSRNTSFSIDKRCKTDTHDTLRNQQHNSFYTEEDDRRGYQSQQNNYVTNYFHPKNVFLNQQAVQIDKYPQFTQKPTSCLRLIENTKPQMSNSLPSNEKGIFILKNSPLYLNSNQIFHPKELQKMPCFPNISDVNSSVQSQDKNIVVSFTEDNKTSNSLVAEDNKTSNSFVAEDHKASTSFFAEDNKANNSFFAEDNKANNSFFAEDNKANNSDNKASNSFLAEDNKANNSFLAKDNKMNNSFIAKDNKVNNSFFAEDNKTNNSFFAKDNKANNSFFAPSLTSNVYMAQNENKRTFFQTVSPSSQDEQRNILIKQLREQVQAQLFPQKQTHQTSIFSDESKIVNPEKSKTDCEFDQPLLEMVELFGSINSLTNSCQSFQKPISSDYTIENNQISRPKEVSTQTTPTSLKSCMRRNVEELATPVDTTVNVSSLQSQDFNSFFSNSQSNKQNIEKNSFNHISDDQLITSIILPSKENGHATSLIEFTKLEDSSNNLHQNNHIKDIFKDKGSDRSKLETNFAYKSSKQSDMECVREETFPSESQNSSMQYNEDMEDQQKNISSQTYVDNEDRGQSPKEFEKDIQFSFKKKQHFRTQNEAEELEISQNNLDMNDSHFSQNPPLNKHQIKASTTPSMQIFSSVNSFNLDSDSELLFKYDYHSGLLIPITHSVDRFSNGARKRQSSRNQVGYRGKSSLASQQNESLKQESKPKKELQKIINIEPNSIAIKSKPLDQQYGTESNKYNSVLNKQGRHQKEELKSQEKPVLRSKPINHRNTLRL